ncbi:MAG: sigma-54 dependent transcriptional regulator [SAR324 cluster bacterium]|nr:sigma-54 dependent transcriptional regulator [SAR324 cluster bacterium]
MNAESSGTVLVVDDNAQSRELAGDVLESVGLRVYLAANGEQCLQMARANHPDVIVLDRIMPGMSGDEVAEKLKSDEQLKDIKIIMLSAMDKSADRVAGLDLGADDYLTKPYNRNELRARVDVHIRTKKAEEALQRAYAEVEQKVAERTVELQTANTQLQQEITERERAEQALKAALGEVEELKDRFQAEAVYLTDEIRLEHNFEEIICESGAFKSVLRSLEQVAPTDATVLILGESGTGKELIARAVHDLSGRSERPLVKVNCAALPENLIESELFGHEKGAFTGALARKIGRFELAHGGTIFLDEIGDLPLSLQTKLLRVLQEGEFERLGNPRTTKVDVRVIAATNRDLEGAVKVGEFREDLYYRLNVFPVHCPPLRVRKEDIAVLAQHFVLKYSAKVGRKIESIPKKAMDALLAYDWPGNVRELENIIERAIILTNGPALELAGELGGLTSSGEYAAAPATLEHAEAGFIRAALEGCGWVIEGPHGAAVRLGLQPSTLRSRMRKLGLRKPEGR